MSLLPLLLIPAAILALADKGALRRLKRQHALREFNRKYNEKMEACLRAHKAILVDRMAHPIEPGEAGS